jgi:hypothetical protein
MGFFGGALSGFADTYSKRKANGQGGLLSKLRNKNKQLPLTRPNASNTTQLTPMAEPSSYRKGGRVKKGGWARVHAGETVVPKKKRGRRSAGKRR